MSIENEPKPVSSTCVVFARSEVIGLLAKMKSVPLVLAAYHSGMTMRLANLVRRIGIRRECTISGGMAKNIGLVSRLENELGIKAVPLSPDPMIAGALGAALFARESLNNTRG